MPSHYHSIGVVLTPHQPSPCPECCTSALHGSLLQTPANFDVRVERTADELVAADYKRWGKMHRSITVNAVREAGMFSCLIGYLPPMRLSCLRTMCHPDKVLSKGGCMDDSCT